MESNSFCMSKKMTQISFLPSRAVSQSCTTEIRVLVDEQWFMKPHWCFDIELVPMILLRIISLTWLSRILLTTGRINMGRYPVTDALRLSAMGTGTCMLSLQSFSIHPQTVPSLSPFAFSSSTIRLNTAPQVSTFWLETLIYSVAKSLRSDATSSLAEA